MFLIHNRLDMHRGQSLAQLHINTYCSSRCTVHSKLLCAAAAGAALQLACAANVTLAMSVTVVGSFAFDPRILELACT
jgi:hypothetical protein